ncbi:MAG: tetratricopeptide repeat protein [Gemmataceae bacterium]
MRDALGWLAVLVVVTQAVGADPTTAEGWLERARQQFAERKYEDAVDACTRCLARDANRDEAVDLRGSAEFMRGRFTAAVADFDRYLKRRPEKANGHWRRGIALYYTGQYAEGMRQFEGYERVDTNDVENAVWHLMCAARKDGLAKARGKVLKVGHDRRVPMMQVYDLYRGALQPADVLKAAEADTVSATERSQRRFYAHLYLGIYHDLLGEKKKAIEHLRLAAEKYHIGHYMGEVARVHLRVLSDGAR